MRQKKNNGGFTLIELLASIAILAIVTIPLMHSFMTASRTNLKSRRILEATTVGQNVMENIKVADVAEFSGAPWQADTDENGVACFSQCDTPETTVNGSKFYVRAYLEAKNFTAQAGETNKVSDYNSNEWANMSNLSKANNAFLIMKPNEATLVAQGIAEMLPPEVELPPAGHPTSCCSDAIGYIKKHGLTRDMTINVSHVPADPTAPGGQQVAIVKVSAKYSFSYGGHTYEYMALDRQEIYNNGTNLDNELTGVFICYYPLDYCETGSLANETVTIENTVNHPLEVYLVKQQGSGGTATASYVLGLNIEEDATALGSTNGGTSVTKVITNLNYDKDSLTAPGLRLSYTSGVTPMKGYFGANGLEKREADERIYTVKLKIYEWKDGGVYEARDLLTEMESTKIK